MSLQPRSNRREFGSGTGLQNCRNQVALHLSTGKVGQMQPVTVWFESLSRVKSPAYPRRGLNARATDCPPPDSSRTCVTTVIILPPAAAPISPETESRRFWCRGSETGTACPRGMWA